MNLNSLSAPVGRNMDDDNGMHDNKRQVANNKAWSTAIGTKLGIHIPVDVTTDKKDTIENGSKGLEVRKKLDESKEGESDGKAFKKVLMSTDNPQEFLAVVFLDIARFDESITVLSVQLQVSKGRIKLRGRDLVLEASRGGCGSEHHSKDASQNKKEREKRTLGECSIERQGTTILDLLFKEEHSTSEETHHNGISQRGRGSSVVRRSDNRHCGRETRRKKKAGNKLAGA